jgi:Domain of unknown function (DUF4157)
MNRRDKQLSTKGGAPFLPARGQLQRACACGQHTNGSGECEGCRKKRIAEAALGANMLRHHAAENRELGEVPEIVQDVLRSPGQPLDVTTRAFFEPRFGHDLGQVRVHTDAAASRSADSIGARAYTSGNQIVFGTGHYETTTGSGRTLLAHELIHVLQQRGSQDPAPPRLTPYWHPAEVEARSASKAVVEGHYVSPVGTAVGLAPQSVSMQGLDPQKIYCALHAAVCLGLSENPPAAALCWANFAARCGGAMASAGQPSEGEALASGTPASEISEGGA